MLNQFKYLVFHVDCLLFVQDKQASYCCLSLLHYHIACFNASYRKQPSVGPVLPLNFSEMSFEFKSYQEVRTKGRWTHKPCYPRSWEFHRCSSTTTGEVDHLHKIFFGFVDD